MVRRRGAEEGIGGDLTARGSPGYLAPAMTAPGVDVRLHDTILYNSIYQVRRRGVGEPARTRSARGAEPGLHFRYIPGGGGRAFQHYMRSLTMRGSVGEPSRQLGHVIHPAERVWLGTWPESTTSTIRTPRRRTASFRPSRSGAQRCRGSLADPQDGHQPVGTPRRWRRRRRVSPRCRSVRETKEETGGSTSR